MKLLVKTVLISAMVCTVLAGEYHIFVKGPQYAVPQSGTVIDANKSTGKYSSTWFATVRFDNSDVQEVNTGHVEYKVGDRFIGSLGWTPITGVYGTAYSWRPDHRIMLLTLPASLANVLLVLGAIIALFVYAFSTGIPKARDCGRK